MLPISLNLSGKLVAVVGGGAVGRRKLAAALDAGARVRLIDPHAVAPSGVEHIEEAYRAAHLDGAALAFACAPPAVNERVVTDGRERRVWVCSASDPDAGDFALPAVVRRGAFTLAVGTGGAAPALARRVRERLESQFDDAFGEWVRVLAAVRADVLEGVTDATRRRELLDAFAGWEWLDRLRAEGAEAVLVAMRAVVASGG
jgi:precorrin-2 dehydrogenase/sirohydrochlorin ferrochelatase